MKKKKRGSVRNPLVKDMCLTEMVGIGGNPVSLKAAKEKISENFDHQKNANRFYRKGLTKVNTGKYNDAIIELKKAYQEAIKSRHLIWYII